MPARYVSGYLYHRRQDKDRSADDATHAWIEAYLPSMGWIGYDPTNNIRAGERHLRVAVGRELALHRARENAEDFVRDDHGVLPASEGSARAATRSCAAASSRRSAASGTSRR